jgi:hypothetical protein
MGGSAIRTDSTTHRRFNVATDVALAQLNARFTEEAMAGWRSAVREQLRQRAALGELARTIDLDDVAPGDGEAFSAWLDEDWTPTAARRLRALLRLLTWSGRPATFAWEACDDWSEFALAVRSCDGSGRDVLVRTPHP